MALQAILVGYGSTIEQIARRSNYLPGNCLMRVPPIDDFAETFSQFSPWREVKGRPAAPLEEPPEIGSGINEPISASINPIAGSLEMR